MSLVLLAGSSDGGGAEGGLLMADFVRFWGTVLSQALGEGERFIFQVRFNFNCLQEVCSVATLFCSIQSKPGTVFHV